MTTGQIGVTNTAQELADDVVRRGLLPAGVPVHAVDANASWARPGTRLVDGVEELAGVLHPGFLSL